MNLTLSTEPWKLRIATLKRVNRNFEAADELSENSLSIQLISNAESIANYDTGFLFDYEIFPHYIMSAKREWEMEKRRMQVEDVIIQRLFVPPLGWGVCIECAVRICTLVSEPSKRGFTYETLPGHVEKGLSEFYISQQDGEISFNIHTRSAPAHWTARLVRPIARSYQSWCTRQALVHVKRRFNEENNLVGAVGPQPNSGF